MKKTKKRLLYMMKDKVQGGTGTCLYCYPSTSTLRFCLKLVLVKAK